MKTIGLNSSQMPPYPNWALVEETASYLKKLPPLLPFESIHSLTQQLKTLQQKKGFLLHVGDCAENMHDTHETAIQKNTNILPQI